MFQAGKIYVFLANNGKYLSRIRRGSVDYLEAEKQSIDTFCLFQASEIGDGKVALKGDKGTWKYVSRIYRGNNNIEVTKDSIDIYSEFTVEIDNNGPWSQAHYVYLKADNGKYIGIVERGAQHNIEAYYDNRDAVTKFIVLEAQ